MTSMLDDLFRALAHPVRRRLLIALAEHNPQADDALHTPGNVPIDNIEREQLQIQLYHAHLPNLENAGLICWDHDTHQVTKGPQFDEIQPILELLSNDPDELSSHKRRAERTYYA